MKSSGPERPEVLLAFHAFMGSCNTGRFSCLGKATWLQLFLHTTGDLISALKILLDRANITEDMLFTLAAFVVTANSSKGVHITNIPDLRWCLFCKHMADNHKLPPNLGALKQHMLRVKIQVAIWVRQAL